MDAFFASVEVLDTRPRAAATCWTLHPDEKVVLDLGDEAPERERLLAALQQTNGNRTAAARILGISRATFYRRLDSLGINA